MTWAKGRPRSHAYRKDRLLVLERDGYRCQIKGPRCLGAGNLDDHIVPVSLGGSDALVNRRCVCKPCHDEKTAREGSAAAAKIRAKASRPVTKHPGLR